MELKIQNQPPSLPSIVTAQAGAVSEHVVERGAEALKQAKQQVSEAYEQTSQRVSEQYGKAVEYGHENPGITTLIAVGVGLGLGLLLASSASALRSRVSS